MNDKNKQENKRGKEDGCVYAKNQSNINSNSITTMPAITTTTTTRTRQETQEETQEGEEQAHLSVQFNQPSKEGKKGRKSECKSNNKTLTPAPVSFVSSFFCSTRKVRKSFLALALAFYLAPFSFPLPSPLSPSPPTTTITLYYRLL